jgi:hypothetical protein
VTSGWESLRRFLETDTADVGCAEALNRLAVYVDRELDCADAEIAYPGVAAHLQVCGPCREDFRGLLAAAHPGG